MLKHIKNLLVNNAFKIAIILTIAILYISLISPQKLPNPDIDHFDKIEHLLAYVVLSFFWLLSFNKDKLTHVVKNIVIVFAVIVYGGIIEILQSALTMTRTGDIYDIIANSTGSVIGFVIFKLVNRLFLHV